MNEFIQRIENIIVSRSKKEMLEIVIENKKNGILNDLLEQSRFHLCLDLGGCIEDNNHVLYNNLSESVFEKVKLDLEELKRMNTLLEQYHLLGPSEPAAEPVSDPVVETVSEPVVEPVSEPVVEPVVEPAAEPAAEPVSEPVVEPAAEPVVEPAAEPAAEPVSEPVVEPAAEPTEPVYNP
jgi:hypothetical protein